MSGAVDKLADQAMDAAVDWLMRRSAGPLAPAEVDAFEAWLADAPENRQAYEEVEWIWAAAAAAEGQPRIEARRRRILAAVEWSHPARRAIAATLMAGILGLGGFGVHVLTGPKPLVTQSFRTAVGQQATVSLPDGSVVTLNTDTVVRTRADGARRLVYLDKGQAFFKVAHDRRHPFVVNAAGRTVTALGTAFDVRLENGGLKVVLVEGKVRVESKSRPLAQPSDIARDPDHPLQAETARVQQATEMSAGSELVASNDADWRLMRVDTARATSWLHRQIVFDDESLGDIVDEMNRYTPNKMTIDDPSLARRRLSGIYTVGDLAAFSEALKGYGVAELKEDAGGKVHVVALK
ncbi:MAG TPA: FecR domain-containing protein [Caulobacteraceae bacterium]|nr:FecR domain-containing protein [Caulobacteraceae bacterium]